MENTLWTLQKKMEKKGTNLFRKKEAVGRLRRLNSTGRLNSFLASETMCYIFQRDYSLF